MNLKWFLLFLVLAIAASYAVAGPVETIDDRIKQLEGRVDALERIIKVCCISQSKPLGVDLDLEITSTLRREFRELKEHMEEMEWWYRRRKR